jgi:uncharacterized protein
MILAVLDTNCIVSALLKPQGNERRILQLALARQFQLLASPAILNEYESVLNRPKLRLTDSEVKNALTGIRRVATLIEPDFTVHVSTDEPDNRFLECAVAGNAEYLVTANPRHFPARWRDVQVVNAKQLLEFLVPKP